MELKIEKSGKYTIYNVLFSSISDLYYYLKSNPKTNTGVFSNCCSFSGNKDFAGDSLFESIEYLVKGYPYDFNNFLDLTKKIQKNIVDLSDYRKTIQAINGGIPIVPLYVADIPNCMSRYERDKNISLLNMFFLLGYPGHNRKEQIFNRGLATLFVIDSLEKNNTIINLVSREVSKVDNEIVNIEIVLKRSSDLLLDIRKCYYPFVSREFLRRILFRVLETIPVKNYWSFSYGRELSKDELIEIFGIAKDDLIIDSPSDMNISGDDIYSDTANLIECLNLTDRFDTQKIRSLRKNIKQE